MTIQFRWIVQQDKLRFDLTFRAKMMLSTCALVLFTGIAVLLVADAGSRATTNALADTLFREVIADAVTQTRGFVLRAAPVAQSLEQLAGNGLALDDPERLAPQLLAFLKGNQGMTRVLYGNESGDYVAATRFPTGALRIERSRIVDGKTRLIESEVLKDGTWKVINQDDTQGYDPRHRPFYLLAKKTGKLSWTAPYMFFSQGVPGISCVIPVKDSANAIRGVFSVEFDLRALSQFVSALSISEHSRVFLFTPDQTLLAHPNLRDIEGRGVGGNGAMLTLADTGDPLVDAFRVHLKPIQSQQSAENEFSFFEFSDHGVDYMASTTTFPIGDGQIWEVGAVAPKSDFFAPVWRARWWSMGAAGIALCLAALIAAAMARQISRPVESLIAFMDRVGAGDLKARADFDGSREFRQLSLALNRMIGDLRDRLRLRNLLDLAMNVQKCLLPAKDPVSPLLDVSGRSKYCDETGGDYYDFIELATLSPTSLVVAIGDVMGHGIPAALVMATARAALRTSALQENRLAELMARTNQVLAADNRHKRFVTMALLMIDAQTRIVRWVSAGHDAAIVFDPGSQTFRELECSGDLMLGVMENLTYEERVSEPLPLQSVMVIGTDGVWEMGNSRKERYGKQRLQDVIRKHHDQSAAAIGAALDADLAAFRGIQSPADDVTFVVIKFVAPEAPRPN